MGWLTDLFARAIADRQMDDEPGRSERERLMRHTGRPECSIYEHVESFRQLGRTTMELDQVRHERDDWIRRARLWRQRARELQHQVAELECRLAHPARGEAA